MKLALALATALAFLATVRAEPVEAHVQASRPSTGSARTEEVVAAIDEIARRYALAGEVLVAQGDRILLDRGYGTIAPVRGARHKAGERWRLASITKQVVAAQVVAKYRDNLAMLDTPWSPPSAGYPPAPTIRQLLLHHSGLANPDNTPKDANGVPAAYLRGIPAFAYCLSQPARPGAPFAYNNCDYLLVGSHRGTESWPAGMSMARSDERGLPGFVHGAPEPVFDLGSFWTAGGLLGTARAVFDFDRSLLTGKLLPPAALAELWKPEGNASYQALGAWVFPGQLGGCAAPKLIVQRDGEIWGVQARNFILPDDDLVVIVFTNRSADDFAFGEVWEGKGFAYDLLSAAVACA